MKWRRKDGKIKQLHNEFMVRYKTTCKHAHLDLAVFTGNAQIREAAGVQIIVEEFDDQRRIFPLDSPDSISMSLFLVRAFFQSCFPRKELNRRFWGTGGQRV